MRTPSREPQEHGGKKSEYKDPVALVLSYSYSIHRFPIWGSPLKILLESVTSFLCYQIHQFRNLNN